MNENVFNYSQLKPHTVNHFKAHMIRLHRVIDQIHGFIFIQNVSTEQHSGHFQETV